MAKCDACGGKMTGLAHIGIFVKSIEESNKFYIDQLGFEDAGRYGNLQFLRVGSCILELVEIADYKPRPAGVIDHIAIEVEDIEKLVCKLTEKRFPFSGEIKTMPDLCGGVKNLFFEGPDGERLEFFEYLNK